MDKYLKSFGKRLEALRKEAGISQLKMAELCKSNQGQISRYERDEAEPGLHTLHKLAGALGITVGALVGDEKPEFAPQRPPSETELLMYIFDKFLHAGDRRDLIRFTLNCDDDALSLLVKVMRGIESAMVKVDKNKLPSSG
jgi:transcriptional regulator with XRE-family HTH domain